MHQTEITYKSCGSVGKAMVTTTVDVNTRGVAAGDGATELLSEGDDFEDEMEMSEEDSSSNNG